MSTPTRHAPTRRTVLRAAAWTAPAVSIAVAAPAFATSHTTPAVSGTRNGANFFVSITYSGTITSVQVGTTPAIWNGASYAAKLTGGAPSVQNVTIVTDHGSVTKSVNFAVLPGTQA